MVILKVCTPTHSSTEDLNPHLPAHFDTVNCDLIYVVVPGLQAPPAYKFSICSSQFEAPDPTPCIACCRRRKSSATSGARKDGRRDRAATLAARHGSLLQTGVLRHTGELCLCVYLCSCVRIHPYVLIRAQVTSSPYLQHSMCSLQPCGAKDGQAAIFKSPVTWNGHQNAILLNVGKRFFFFFSHKFQYFPLSFSTQ